MYEPRLYSFFRFFFAWIDRYPMNTTEATTRTTSNHTPWHPGEPSWPSALAGMSTGWREKGGDSGLIWRLVVDIFPVFVWSVGVMETLILDCWALFGWWENKRERWRKGKKKKKKVFLRDCDEMKSLRVVGLGRVEFRWTCREQKWLVDTTPYYFKLLFFFPNLWQLIKFNWLGFVVNVPIIFTTLYTGKEVKWFQQWVKIRINKNLSHMICYESIMKMLWLTTNYLDGCEIFVFAKSLYLEKLELITTCYLWFIFLQHFHNKY